MAINYKFTGSPADPSSVAAVAVTSAGSGYTSTPSVAVSGGGGSGAVISAALAARGVGSFAMVNGGSGYTSAPTVSFSGGGGTGAAATATIGYIITQITVNGAGSGYTSAPNLIFGGWSFQGGVPTAQAVISGGQLVAVNLLTNFPVITIGAITLDGGGGSGASVSPTVGNGVISLALTNAGTGYTSAPTVAFAGGGGTGAAYTAILAAGGVGSLSIVTPGSGYTSAPSLAFSGGGGTGAAGTASLEGIVTADQTATALGISRLTRTRRNLALDEVTFEVESAAVDAVPLFGLGTVVTIKRDDGTTDPIWFKGRVVEVPRRGSGSGESHTYRLAGTWWYLDNLVYQQIWPLDASANSHLTSPTTYRRALAIVGMASTTGLRQNTKDFIVDVLDFLIAAAEADVCQYTAAELPAGFNVPFTRLDSPTCAEALRWVCRWIADAASWFDYAETPPKFNLQRRAAATSVELALTALAEVEVTPRADLKLDHLVIQFVTLNDSGLVVLHEDKDPSTATGREWGAGVFTIDNNYQALPTGLAANYRAGLSVLPYAGRAVIEEAECAQTVRPGHLLNITGGASEWATMAAQVQEVTEEIDTGRTVITFGPPAHIRLDDLIEILKIARNQSDEFGGSGEILKTGRNSKTQVITQALTVAGVVPTAAEIKTALESAYSGKPAPRSGDIVNLTVGVDVKFRAHVHTLSSTTSGAFVVGFKVSRKTYYGHVHQTGIY